MSANHTISRRLRRSPCGEEALPRPGRGDTLRENGVSRGVNLRAWLLPTAAPGRDGAGAGAGAPVPHAAAPSWEDFNRGDGS